ncbi:uncharacterized protein VTP21DRAFT_10647 [Calcarisporiella thermophila]|uniref:uncharacterized protein n=1 Tax=Calcarisporiella thermophila TaxID=911321 RepID=UPI003742516A
MFCLNGLEPNLTPSLRRPSPLNCKKLLKRVAQPPSSWLIFANACVLAVPASVSASKQEPELLDISPAIIKLDERIRVTYPYEENMPFNYSDNICECTGSIYEMISQTNPAFQGILL